MECAQREPLRILLCSAEPRVSSCSVIRIVAPLHRDPGIEMRWWETENAQEQVDWAQAIVIQRNFPSSALRNRRILRRVYASGKPILYETDDDLLNTPLGNPHYGNHKEGRPFLRRALRHAHAILVSTPYLAREMDSGKSCLVVPNLLDDRIWNPVAVADRPWPVVIGFAGTATHSGDLRSCAPALHKIADEHGNGVRFRFLGCSVPELESLPNSRFEPFQVDYASYAAGLQESGVHIGIAPLLDTPFNRAKSAIKWMEMSMSGIAGVYSKLDPYRDVVSHGINGLFADQDWESWYRALDSLVRNPSLRCAIASKAQADVLAYHTLSAKAGLLSQAIRTLVSDLGSRPENLRLNRLRRLRNFLWY